MEKEQGKVCCFIGHKKFIGAKAEAMKDLQIRMMPTIEKMITEFNVTRFLFGSPTDFDVYCHFIVGLFLEEYPQVKRIYIRERAGGSNEMQEQFLRLQFDEVIFPERVRKAGKGCYIERDKIMIDESDFCVFYYDREHGEQNPKSGTTKAYKYALQRGKTVISLYKPLKK